MISRREFLTSTTAASAALLGSQWLLGIPDAVAKPVWPPPEVWDTLKAEVGGRLIMVESPLQACKDNLSGPYCATALENLQNPFFNEDEPGATQTTGWMDAWTAGSGLDPM